MLQCRIWSNVGRNSNCTDSKKIGENSKCTLWIDSASDLIKIEAIDNTPTTHNDALTKEYLLINDTKKAILWLGGTLERKWVEWHQKNTDTLEAKINSKADELANEQRLRQGK